MAFTPQTAEQLREWAQLLTRWVKAPKPVYETPPYRLPEDAAFIRPTRAETKRKARGAGGGGKAEGKRPRVLAEGSSGGGGSGSEESG